MSNSSVSGLPAANGTLGIYNWGGTLIVGYASGIGINVWHHVLFTYDGTVNRLYLDGVQVASNTNAHQSATPTILTIGAEPQFNFNYLNGVEDDIRIYNRALSAMEVKQLYNLGAAKIGHSNDVALSNGLVGYWTFDGKDTNWSTGKAKDISGNGNDGSLGLMSTTSSPTPGKIGQALNFNGSSNNVAFTSPSLSSAFFSIAGWIYGNDISVNSVWLSVGSVQNDNKSIHLRVGSGGYVRFGFYNNDLDSNTGVFSANKWNHIVNTYDVTSGNRSTMPRHW